MKKLKNILITIILILYFISVFRNLFFTNAIAGGDLRFIYETMYANYSIFPYAWLPNETIGLGSFVAPVAWVYFITSLPVVFFGILLKQNWNAVVILGYLIPFYAISFFSIRALFKKHFDKSYFYLLSFILYVTNTYILMVLGGGQVLITLSYAVFPLVIFTVINSTNKLSKALSHSKANLTSLKTMIGTVCVSGFVFSLQILLDSRIAYISFAAVVIYLFFQLVFFTEKRLLNIILLFLVGLIIPLLIAFFINMFWILPTLLMKENPLENFGSAYTTINAVNYFSFAKFENSISLLHPYWPENVFGKVGFMKPEFILLSIFVFASLFFYKSLKNFKEKRLIIYLLILTLIGIFLAKGSNEPFGKIYLWMFSYIPGFILFRDPTKWYMYIALGYSILIPFSVSKVFELLKFQPSFKILNFKFQIKTRNQLFNLQNFFLVVVAIYLLFLVYPVITGQLSGIFKRTEVPVDYIKLEKYLSSQDNYFRTLWFPKAQRFSFYSNNHPQIPAYDLFNIYDLNLLQDKIKELGANKLLQQASIKYVIVPYDNENEIFLTDRKYDEKKYLQAVKTLSLIPQLKRVGGFDKIAVFELNNPRDHFYISDKQQEISDKRLSYKYISPVEYNVNLKNIKKGDLLIFSESFDKNWSLITDNSKVQSKKYSLFNSFELKKEGSYSARIYYEPQKYVDIGLIVSGFTLFAILGCIFYSKFKK